MWPPFLPFENWELAALALGLVALAVGNATWTLGCLRVAWHGDWCASFVLAAGGWCVVPVALAGRLFLEQLWGPGWVGYAVPYLGLITHRYFTLTGDDGFVWIAVGVGLALGGAGLLSIGGLPRPVDLEREVEP